MENQNYKRGNISLIVSALLVLLFFVCCSCSSRKVQKSETKISESASSESTKVDSSKIVTVTDTNIKIVDSSSEEEITIQPLDSSKVIVIGNVKYKNVVLKRHKSKKNKEVVKSENVAKTEQKAVKTTDKHESSKTVEQQIKNSERKSGFPWWILILIAVAGILYFAWRKYKRLPLV